MPMDLRRYPPAWRAISRTVRERAGQRCECAGECGADHRGRCDAPNGGTIVRAVADPARWMLWSAFLAGIDERWPAESCHAPVRVVLTVAHLDHDPAGDDPARMRALCQRCHLRYDAAHHARNARATRMGRRAVGTLPGVDDREVDRG
jgi:hypothetical protein